MPLPSDAMTAIPELRNVDPRPFWQATMPDPPDRRGRDLPDAVDVVVVGGGLMGLSAARRAAELGASVVLLEAERIGWGASTRNGGFCHPGFKQSLTALRRLHGVERAETLYRETIEAFEHVERLCTTSIDAEFERTGHLVLASAPSHAAALRRRGRRDARAWAWRRTWCRGRTCGPRSAATRTSAGSSWSRAPGSTRPG